MTDVDHICTLRSSLQTTSCSCYITLEKKISIFTIFMPPLKKGAYCFATVSRSVCWSVQVLSAQYFLTPSLDQYQTWCRVSRWSLLIFRSHVQRSRSNHSFEPSVLSTLYILIPCLLASDRICFYREDKLYYMLSQRSRLNFILFT